MKALWMLATLLTAEALFGSEAVAQARNATSRAPESKLETAVKPPDLAARARTVAQLEAWLRRLVGRYEVKGTVGQYLNNGRLTSRGITGVMECTGIGDGPGVHCLIKASWAGISFLVLDGRGAASPTLSEVSNVLNPAVLLFALNREDLEIQYMRVDDHGIADEWSGRLNGETVEFKPIDPACWGPLSLPHCPTLPKISLMSGGKTVSVVLAKNGANTVELVLHRQ